MDWTPEQHAVLAHPLDAHAVVRAAPGAGKTTTLVGRVRRLLDEGVEPGRIRVVMFNRDVRQTFVQRLGRADVRVTTFDALGLEVLRVAERERLLSRPLQVDPDLTRPFASAAFRAHPDAFDDPEEIERAVSFWKAHLVPPASAAFPSNPPLVEAYRAWERRRLEGSTLRVAYEDMVYTAVGVLRRHPRLLGPIGHVLVDEFQDVNPGRVELLRGLMHEGTAIMAVGDEDQGINEWIGAHPRFFREFGATFPGLPVREYRLSRTFRFGPALAEAASRLIAVNVERSPGVIVGGGEHGRIERVEDVVPAVHRLLTTGTAPADIAVLYRARTQGAAVLAALLGAGVPIHTEDTSLLRYGRGPELAFAYLRAATSDAPVDFEAAWRVVFAPDRYIQKEAFAAQVKRTGRKGLLAVVEDRAGAVEAGQGPGALRSLGDLARVLRRMRKAGKAAAALDVLVDELDVDDQIRARLRSEREQETAIACFHALRALFRGSAVAAADAEAAVEALDPRQGRAAEECVRVCTIHKAKGLEWRHVFLPGLLEGACPAEQRGQIVGTVEHPEGLPQSPWVEQERRIFYVGVTRAREVAWLHAPQPDASRFVDELLGRAPAPAGKTATGTAGAGGRKKGVASSAEAVVEALTGPPSGGRPWTPEQDDELGAGWEAGQTVPELAERLGRSKSAIAARLVRLAYVDSRQEARARR